MGRFPVAGASEYLAITGFLIKDIKLAKKACILPGQVYTRFDISHVNYTFEVQGMSSEKRPFILPAVFTIGPRTDDKHALLKYAKLISRHDKLSNHELIQGVIEGETRVLAASMTMEEIFKGINEFKQTLSDKAQLQLNQFGLTIYNANLGCLPEYFSFPDQNTLQQAANKAMVDDAEAIMKGGIGAKVREGETKQNVAKVGAETKTYSKQREGDAKWQEVRVTTEVKIFENKRDAEVAEANAELAKKKASWERETSLTQVEATDTVAPAQLEVLLVDPPNITNESAMEIPSAYPPYSSGESSFPLEIHSFNPHSTEDPSEDESNRRLFELVQPGPVAGLSSILLIHTPESVERNHIVTYNAYVVSLYVSTFTCFGLYIYSMFKITPSPYSVWFQQRIITISTGSVLISITLRLSFLPSSTNMVYDGLSFLVICGIISSYLWYRWKKVSNLRQTAGSEPYYMNSASEV